MPQLPSSLARIPLRVSFVPSWGCVHFCSFCADNSGKRVAHFPFEIIKKSILSYSFPLKSVALYNACDAMAYRWQEGKRMYTVLEIIELFKKKGCRELLLSSPGIAPGYRNKKIVDTIAADRSISLMLSFNREHALYEHRMRDFYWTAKTVLAQRRLIIRMVYCSPGEKEVLKKELQRMFGKEMLCDPVTRRGVTVESVPAAPLGRARALYFHNAGKDREWYRKTELMLLQLFREERELREIRYIAEGNYADFIQHAAAQFSGMFIFLFVPGDGGGELILKATDVAKAVRTGGAAFATLYRYNPAIGKFSHTGSDGTVAVLDCLLVNILKCSLPDFIHFINNRISPEEQQSAGRLFSAIMASDIMSEKCAINDSYRMIYLNGEYIAYFQKAFEMALASRGIQSRIVRRFFPLILEYLHKKGEVI